MAGHHHSSPQPGPYGAPPTDPCSQRTATARTVRVQQPTGAGHRRSHRTATAIAADAQKRGGIPPIAIIGIVAAVLIVAIGGIAIAASRGGGNAATRRFRPERNRHRVNADRQRR